MCTPFGANSSSTACSGHGTCLASLNACLCDAGFTAGADFFELQVGTDPVTGQPLQIDCLTSNIGSIVMWSIYLTCVTVRLGYVCTALWRQHVKGELIQRGKNARNKFIFVDLFVITPLFYATGILKLVNSQTYSIGSSIALTLCYIIPLCLVVWVWSEFEMARFKVLVRSGNLSPGSDAMSETLVWRHKVASRLIVVSYVVLTGIPTVAALFLNKSLGPIDSKEWIIIILRNTGVIVWMILAVTASLMSRRQSHAILALLAGSGTSGAVHAAAVKSTAAQRVVQYMTQQTNKQTREYSFAAVMYIVFVTPPLWAFQTYSIALAASLIVLEISPSKYMTQSAHSATEHGSTSDLKPHLTVPL